MSLRFVSLLLVLAAGLVLSPAGRAAITPEQQKEIAGIRKDLGRVPSLVAKKAHEEAERLVDDSERKLKQIVKDAGVDESHKSIAPLLRLIEQRRAALSKKPGGDGRTSAPSFEADVAPILVARCLNCHGERNPRGGLRIGTFEQILRGCDGRFVVPGKPQESTLIERITATGNRRMPRNGDPLPAEEIRRITGWIAAGAKFTGDHSAPLTRIAKGSVAERKADAAPVEISRPSGGETVSFVSDIAPFMVNLCLGCHSGNGRGVEESGFSLETFEKLMRGGRGGRVIVPGNPDASRLWQLVGKQDPIKMPPGESLITRTNHRNLEIWIREGARFDGTEGQARAPLRSLVPTEDERRAKELAALGTEELDQRRRSRALELWTAAFPKESPTEHSTDGFTILGNSEASHLAQIGAWAEDDAGTLRRLFAIRDAQIWRGRLTVFVFKDRFSYSEFVLTNEKAELPADVKGHARVSAGGSEGYVCLADSGDSDDDASPGVRLKLMELLTEALLQRSQQRVPDWAARGLGLALASRQDPKHHYFHQLAATANDAVRTLDKPQDLFRNGTFSSSELPAVGYTLVTHMIKSRGEGQFVRFVSQLGAGQSLAEALKSVYSSDPETLSRTYLSSLDSARTPPRRKPRAK